jgi:hypothetical protein
MAPHISTMATATDSNNADADLKIEDASPLSQGVTGDLKKKKKKRDNFIR